MVEKSVITAIEQYLKALPAEGIHATHAVLFGSFANGGAHEWSDIDLVVIASEFDRDYDLLSVKALWRATLRADSRIEPIPCGEREWAEGSDRPIIEIARREGIVIAA